MDDFMQLSFAQFNQFHFIRPQWLWLLAVFLMVWLLRRQYSQSAQWRSIIPAHLAQVLLKKSGPQTRQKQGRTLLIMWFIGTLALAGPTWQKVEKPVFQVKRASVILMDMSLSMRATDIKPNRLTRARFKAMDLAEAIGEGEVALVAYAGDAFTISPLTPDARNLTTLIPSLTPEIMPELGSYPLLGLLRSAQLLNQAGYLTGDIFWFTDGIDDFDLQQLREFAAQTPYRINIMALGTSGGAPIKMADGSLMKDGTGSIVIPKMSTDALITIANMTGGLFVTTSANDRDVQTLAALTEAPKADNDATSDEDEQKQTGDDWHEFGPYLVLMLLPFFLVKFRRGATLLALFVIGLTGQPQPVYAAAQDTTNVATGPQPGATTALPNAEQAPQVATPTPWYKKIFKRSDEIAQESYLNQDYAQAAADFKNENWKGAAHYKNKNYEAALQSFEQDDSADGWYNRGNALAHLNQIKEAIAAYQQALTRRPQHQAAQENKALLEKLLEQQEQQQSENGEQQNQEQQDGGQEQQSEQQQGSEGENQSESSSESQQQESQSQGDQQPEPSADASSEEQQQQQAQTGDEQSEQEQQTPQEVSQNAQQDADAQDQAEQSAMTPLTAEQIAEQEQQQKIEQLLRKVSDDPATLLRNKMILESRKRKPNNRAPKGAKQSW